MARELKRGELEGSSVAPYAETTTEEYRELAPLSIPEPGGFALAVARFSIQVLLLPVRILQSRRRGARRR